MGEREVRVGFQRGGKPDRRIETVGQVAGDEMIESSGGLGARGRDRKTAGIDCMAFLLAYGSVASRPSSNDVVRP